MFLNLPFHDSISQRNTEALCCTAKLSVSQCSTHERVRKCTEESVSQTILSFNQRLDLLQPCIYLTVSKRETFHNVDISKEINGIRNSIIHYREVFDMLSL